MLEWLSEVRRINMMKRIIFAFIGMALSMSVAHAASVNTNPGSNVLHVIPYPKEVTWLNGNFKIDKKTIIVPGNPKRENDIFAISQLREEIKIQLGLNLTVKNKPAGSNFIVVGLSTDPIVESAAKKQGIDKSDVTEAEGYALSIGGDGIVLSGADNDGTFYAVQSLRQIIRSERTNKGVLKKVQIKDWPSFHFRGITDDISRGPVPTMDTIKQSLRRLSELKINKFNFYIEHVFEYKKHPLIGPKGGSLTADQIRELDAYAKKYHIELVGGLQSFGHFAHILKIRKYLPLSENVITPWVLTPAKEESYQLLSDMYSEIAPTFSSTLFNISCDETNGLGEGKSKKMVQEHGIEWVYAYHIKRVHELLAGQGKRVMMWADIALKHPGILDMLPMDLIFLPWAYDAKDSFDDMLIPISRTKHDFIVCPGVNCWNRMFPNTKNARINIMNFARDGEKYNAMGVLNTTWDDDGENLFGYNWYPLSWGADASWNPLNQNQDRFDASFARIFYGAKDDMLVKGILQIEKSASVMDFYDLGDKHFWSWPPVTTRSSEKMARVDAKYLIEYSDNAIKYFAEAKKSATVNIDNIEFLLFSAHRMKNLGERRLDYFRYAALYKKAFENQDADREEVLAVLGKIDASLNKMRKDLDAIWKEYKKVWFMENRPYWLDKNEEKYKNLMNGIGKTEESVKAATEAYKKGEPLPDNETVGLPLP